MSHSAQGRLREVWQHMLEEADATDKAICDAVANTPTPTLDGPMAFLSNAANYSGVWLFTSAVLASMGGPAGRRAAVRGLAAIAASSATANLVAKQLLHRERPARSYVSGARLAAVTPKSGSFPSGHTASAFAFATAVTAELPQLALPLYGLASVVAYSRVHNEVHYPSDVMAGAILGLAVGTAIGEGSVRVGNQSLP